MIACTVELFGVARLIARASVIHLDLPEGATFADVFGELANRAPALAGRVIARDGQRLVDGYACNVNGLEFVRSSAGTVGTGDNIAILSADAGG